MLVPLQIPPGVYRNGTNYQAVGRWYDANLIRWYEGALRPAGGWQKAIDNTFAGVCRGLLSWHDNTQNRWCAIGTNSNLIIYNGGSTYDITPAGFVVGRVDSFPGIGYGYGPYGTGNYGAPPNVVEILPAATWSLDTWGDWLVGCSNADGTLWSWQPEATDAVSTPATAVPNAPTKNTGLIVSQEDYLFALGANGDVRSIMWSDQGDFTTWTPAQTNTAGDLRLHTQGRILRARLYRGQVIIWTDDDLHALNYLGPPLVYGIERVGINCGLIGPNAVEVTEQSCVWMGNNAFFAYDGAMHSVPSDVNDYVFSDINMVQAAKVYAALNSLFGEVWWFYPSSASTENDRYVVWNYRENHWTIGQLARTAWQDVGVFPYPLATDATGWLYEHENSWTAAGAPLLGQRFVEAGPVQIANGDRVACVVQLLADERTSGQVQLSFDAKFTPESPAYSYGPYLIQPYTDVRFTGRQISPVITSAADADWRVGTLRLDTIQGGRR